MTFDYTRSKASADRLITRFGQSATLRRPSTTGAAYNPTPGDPDNHPVTVVTLDYSTSEIDGTRILATDRRVLMAKRSLAIEPTSSDKLVIGGVSYSIIPPVKPLSPGGVVVLYELQARK